MQIGERVYPEPLLRQGRRADFLTIVPRRVNVETMLVAERFACAVQISPSSGAGQDRAAVFAVEDGIVIALADGAGGTGGGAAAAQAVVDAVGAVVASRPAWATVLAGLDQDPVRLGHGQTTAIVLTITDRGIDGAAVGDSGAWLIRGDGVVDFTEAQRRKPLVGSGAIPVVVRFGPLGDGTLLVASDGLLRYAKRDDIAHIAAGPDLAAAATQLVELVRLRSGALQGDVAIVLCRSVV